MDNNNNKKKNVSELKEAARRGDVELLKECVASNTNSPDYYLTLFSLRDGYYDVEGNFLHIAAWTENEEFIRCAIDELSSLSFGPDVVNQLLCQPSDPWDEWNPLHVAARKGNVEIVKMLGNAFNSSSTSSSSSTPPWLLRNRIGETPIQTAFRVLKENDEQHGREGDIECALQILKMDYTGELSNIIDYHGNSLLYFAIEEEYPNIAMEILKSCHSFSVTGPNGLHALHAAPKLAFAEEWEDMLKLLVQKEPKLITQKADNGETIFHVWASKGYLWPFEWFLYSDDIIQNLSKISVELIVTINNEGMNPIHTSFNSESWVGGSLNPINTSFNSESWVGGSLSEHVKIAKLQRANIAKLLVDTYREQANTQISSGISTEVQVPWLVKDYAGNTPLHYAITNGFEKIATMILLKGENAMHLAPKCNNEQIFKLMLKWHPELLKTVDTSGNTILHSWVKIGRVWPFEYLLVNQGKNINNTWRNYLVELISRQNDTDKNNPCHVAASQTSETAHQVVKLLTKAFREEHPTWTSKNLLPWCLKNADGEGALHLALRCQPDQNIALHLLSLHHHEPLEELLDYYEPEAHKILFLAVEKNFLEVVKTILKRLNISSRAKYIEDSSNKQNILHIASACKNKELGIWLVENLPELITKKDENQITPLAKASDNGVDWIIETMLKVDPVQAFSELPLAWIKACEKGHVSVLRMYIEYCPKKFSDHCIEYKDSPLHHIKLRNIVAYEEFIKIRHMKDVINTQDSNKATPLHKAIENQDLFLAEVLLNMDDIRYNIKDKNGKTSRDLLAISCKDDPQWDQMCKSIGFDPNLKTSYFRRKTNLLEARNTLSVVAALLATITFTAGFTIPGGFDQNNGEALLADKAAFLVFLISDTLAMCLSMLVLICLIWSMIFEPNKALFFIDRSVGLIRLSIYLTLLSFVTGVYIVISRKSLGAAIFIIVICSLIGIISATRSLLYRALSLVQFLTSFEDNESGEQISLMEQGNP